MGQGGSEEDPSTSQLSSAQQQLRGSIYTKHCDFGPSFTFSFHSFSNYSHFTLAHLIPAGAVPWSSFHLLPVAEAQAGAALGCMVHLEVFASLLEVAAVAA